jgi:hypothetical protein
MARSYATITVRIHEDDFKLLPAGPRCLYFLLVTQADIAACGYLPLTLRRWALDLAEEDRGNLTDWIKHLEAARFVLVDPDTEELLVRTFAKHDGGYKNPKRLLSVRSSANAVRSPFLRRALAEELGKLGISDWDLSRIEPPSIPVPSPPDPTRSVVTLVSTDHTPESTILKSEPAALPGGAHANDFCDEHQPDGTDADCGKCARKRVRNERLKTTREQRAIEYRERQNQIRLDCNLCDDKGWLLGNPDKPRRCSHPRSTL